MADYYKTLGVAKGASAQELKDAYRKLAKQYHPDKNPGDKTAEQKFKDINAAYDVLKDDQKRAAYDRYGEAAFQGGMGGGGGGFGPGGFDFASSSFADIFEDLFSGGMGGAGGGRGRQAAANQRGSDLRHNLEISLEQAWRGDKVTIPITTQGVCDTCSGSGSADKSAPTLCATCHGSGRVRMQQGFFTLERTCATCQGTGHVIVNPCRTCGGTGRTRKSKTLSVSIPAGVEEGTRIRLAGEGEAGMRGGAAGDLYIFVSLKPHKLFVREGHDLHCHVPIPMGTAVLGGQVEVPTIEGAKARISIPAGTQSGHRLRLKGKGMPDMRRRGSFGDLYVHTQVETPVNLSHAEQELVERFAAEAGAKTQPEVTEFQRKTEEFLRQFKQ